MSWSRSIKSALGLIDSPPGDVQLPNESGKRDPKLPPASTRTSLKEGWASLKAKGLVGKKQTPSTDKSLTSTRSASKR